MHIPTTIEFSIHLQHQGSGPLSNCYHDITASNDSDKAQIFNVCSRVATQQLLRLTWTQHLPRVY